MNIGIIFIMLIWELYKKKYIKKVKKLFFRRVFKAGFSRTLAQWRYKWRSTLIFIRHVHIGKVKDKYMYLRKTMFNGAKVCETSNYKKNDSYIFSNSSQKFYSEYTTYMYTLNLNFKKRELCFFHFSIYGYIYWLKI